LAGGIVIIKQKTGIVPLPKKPLSDEKNLPEDDKENKKERSHSPPNQPSS
jgi:hypothetical protein